MNTKFHYNNLYTSSPLPCGDFLLYQAGEMYCGGAGGVKEHEQYCYEITYGVDGQGEVSTDGSYTPIAKNCCYFSMTGEKHAIASDPMEPLRFKFLGFAPATAEGEKLIELIKSYAVSAEDRLTHIAALNKLFLDVFDEIESPDVFSAKLIGNAITNIAVEVIRAYEHRTRSGFTDKLTHGKELVYHVINYLDTHMTEINSLYELESVFNYSYNHISASFRKTMNMTVNDYLTKIKMDEAKKLLLGGEYSVTEISDRLNFSCIHAFSRSFKNHFGVSPKQFISQNKA